MNLAVTPVAKAVALNMTAKQGACARSDECSAKSSSDGMPEETAADPANDSAGSTAATPAIATTVRAAIIVMSVVVARVRC